MCFIILSSVSRLFSRSETLVVGHGFSHFVFLSCVCARTVGGIYTVIQTKARLTAEEWGENYFLVGPYVESNVRTQVELIEPTNPILKRTIEKMNSSGCKVPERVHSGRTVTPLSPLFFFF